MGRETFVKRVDAHAVGGGEQRELLVDDGLYGRDVVEPVLERVGGLFERCEGEKLLAAAFLERAEFFEEKLAELLVRLGQQLFLSLPLLFFEIGIEIIGVRLEQGSEHAPVPVDDVHQHLLYRVVASAERVVLLPEHSGRMLHFVFQRRVEKDRERKVVEYGHSGPRECVNHTAQKFFLEILALLLPAGHEVLEAGRSAILAHGLIPFHRWSPVPTR